MSCHAMATPKCTGTIGTLGTVLGGPHAVSSL